MSSLLCWGASSNGIRRHERQILAKRANCAETNPVVAAIFERIATKKHPEACKSQGGWRPTPLPEGSAREKPEDLFSVP
jgi:hypothetical protein